MLGMLCCLNCWIFSNTTRLYVPFISLVLLFFLLSRRCELVRSYSLQLIPEVSGFVSRISLLTSFPCLDSSASCLSDTSLFSVRNEFKLLESCVMKFARELV
uniref:Uncharacterized protein n=1 Tax=Cacopsylla melanoneura TaxID=428564 RepID=A0A8D8LY60_9HEMI